MNVFEALVVFF